MSDAHYACTQRAASDCYTLDNNAYQYRLRHSVVCSLHFLIHNCVPLFVRFLLTSYTQFRNNSDNVHKDDGNRVLFTNLLCENTSNVRRVAHDSFPLASRDSLSLKRMQWFENTVLSDFLCIALK